MFWHRLVEPISERSLKVRPPFHPLQQQLSAKPAVWGSSLLSVSTEKFREMGFSLPVQFGKAIPGLSAAVKSISAIPGRARMGLLCPWWWFCAMGNFISSCGNAATQWSTRLKGVYTPRWHGDQCGRLLCLMPGWPLGEALRSQISSNNLAFPTPAQSDFYLHWSSVLPHTHFTHSIESPDEGKKLPIFLVIKKFLDCEQQFLGFLSSLPFTWWYCDPSPFGVISVWKKPDFNLI